MMSQANFFLQFKSVVNKSAELKIVTWPKSNFRLTWAPKVGLPPPPPVGGLGGGCYVSGKNYYLNNLQMNLNKQTFLINMIVVDFMFE